MDLNATQQGAHVGSLGASQLLVIDDHAGEMFGGFQSDEDTEQFNRLIVGLTETWCCRRNGTVVHEMRQLTTAR